MEIKFQIDLFSPSIRIPVNVMDGTFAFDINNGHIAGDSRTVDSGCRGFPALTCSCHPRAK